MVYNFKNGYKTKSVPQMKLHNMPMQK